MYEQHRQKLIPSYSLKDCVIDAENTGRNIYNENYPKAPIWLLGCSYAWGYLLDNDKTFGAKISELTKRPVYNWSYPGIGPAEELMRIYTEKNNKYLPRTAPECAIYIYMYNHFSRYPRDYNTIFILKQFGVLDEKNTPFDRLYLTKCIRQGFFNRNIENDNAKKEFMKKVFFAMKNEIIKKYPQTKFVILLYNDTNTDFNDGHTQMGDNEYDLLNSKEYWQEYKDNDIEVISTKDLIGREMDRKEDRVAEDTAATPHPILSFQNS